MAKATQIPLPNPQVCPLCEGQKYVADSERILPKEIALCGNCMGTGVYLQKLPTIMDAQRERGRDMWKVSKLRVAYLNNVTGKRRSRIKAQLLNLQWRWAHFVKAKCFPPRGARRPKYRDADCQLKFRIINGGQHEAQ